MTTVYGIYSIDGNLLYIGQTRRLCKRVWHHTNHRTSKVRSWMKETRRKVEFRAIGSYYDPFTAKEIEIRMINAMKPPLNEYCAGASFRSRYVLRPKRGHSKTRVVVTNNHDVMK